MERTELYETREHELYCVVLIGDDARNIIFEDYIRELQQLGSENTTFVFAACEGFPNAEQYDSAQHGDKAIWDFYKELQQDATLVASFDLDGMARIADGGDAARELLDGTEDLDITADPSSARKRKKKLTEALKEKLENLANSRREELAALPNLQLMETRSDEIFLLQAMLNWFSQNASKFSSIQIRGLLCSDNLVQEIIVQAEPYLYDTRLGLVLSNAFATVAYNNLQFGKLFLLVEEKRRIVLYAELNQKNSRGKYIAKQMEKNPYPDFATVRRIYNKVCTMISDDKLAKAPSKSREKGKGKYKQKTR